MSNQKIRKYTIEDRIRNASDELKALFYLLDSQILKLNDVHNYATGAYIGYKQINNKSPFVEMHIRNKKELIALHLRPINHFSSSLTLRQVPDTHSWKLNTIVDVYVSEDLEPVMDLIKKSYYEVYKL